jgi:uncharacterized membrane protein
MEPTDQYNFSIFSPRNKHGRKNRNVILTMLAIWVVAVFGFQFLLRIIEKPTPEKTLTIFESEWPNMVEEGNSPPDYKAFMNSLLLVMGKNTVTSADKQLLSEVISAVTFKMVPDTIGSQVLGLVAERDLLKANLPQLKGQEFLDVRIKVQDLKKQIIEMLDPYTGFEPESLEATILAANIKKDYPSSFKDERFIRLPDLMKLYLTHNQSVLTDTKFLGFPFHYFYTAVFLLVLFVVLCIVYNVLVEWRLNKEGIVE